jgi:hypothetical protein
LHKFKSLAGLAGAERLSIVTAGFEAQCRAGCIEIDMPLMRGLLAETSQELKRLIDTMDPPPPETCAAGVPALLRELDDLLRERNMRALEVCAAIERSRDDIADDPFAAVAQAVEALDFATAQRALNAIAEMADAG